MVKKHPRPKARRCLREEQTKKRTVGVGPPERETPQLPGAPTEERDEVEYDCKWVAKGKKFQNKTFVANWERSVAVGENITRK